jgi:hypothetical protein
MTKRNPHPDNELIEELAAGGAPGQQSRSGGNIARDVGTRAELDNLLRGAGVERVTGKDNPAEDATTGARTAAKIRRGDQNR